MNKSIYLVSKNSSLIASSFNLSTIDEAVEYLSTKQLLGIDTETEGFDFTCKKLLMLQIGDTDRQYVIDCRTLSKEDCDKLIPILEDESIIKILHNAKFDYKFIKHYIHADLNNIHDTYLCEKILHCGKTDYGFGLAKLVKRYLNRELDKSVRNRFVQSSSTPFTDDQIIYGAKDIEYLIDIFYQQTDLLKLQTLTSVAKLENWAVVVFSEIEYNGLEINLEAWSRLAAKNKEESFLLGKQLDKLLLSFPEFNHYKAKKQLDLFLAEEELKDSTVNWDSPSQVLKIFQVINPKIEDVNGKKLAPYRYKHTLINEYIKYKEKSKLASAFGANFNSYISCDGKVHTNFQQILDTGRVSSSEPNMQQIPATNEYRNCFTCPHGWVFVSSDYSSQELNVIAYGSGDPVFLKALKNNEDLHSVCAELVFGQVWHDAAESDCAFVKANQKCECKEHKKLRTQVKTINFGLAYGMGPKKLSETINSTLSEAKELIDKYFKAFPKIKKFLNDQGEFGKRYGFVTTFHPFYRKRWFDTWIPKMYNDRDSFMELGSIERASKNTPIQGSSADMTKLALVYLHNRIKKFGYPVKIVMTVHDQIDTICPEEFAEEWKVYMTEEMERAASKIIRNGLLKADTSITKVWSK
jgi:DNA polymerase I-like protein with 3'-5' exonuclease and polymerase domains